MHPILTKHLVYFAVVLETCFQHFKKKTSVYNDTMYILPVCDQEESAAIFDSILNTQIGAASPEKSWPLARCTYNLVISLLRLSPEIVPCKDKL